MKTNYFFVLLSFLYLSITCGYSQKKVLYKEVDSTSLYMDIYFPDQIDSTKTYPGIIFFFGGGWSYANLDQFESHANYFAKRGMISIIADYRVKKRNGSTPFEALKDAKSAMRFIRQHAEKFYLDPNKITAAGGSAGGHLAAATALIEDYNESTDDLSLDCKPNALVLFNPVIDNGPGGYGYERIGEEYKKFSPLHNLKKGAPPTLLFLGTEDRLVPVETAKYYQVVMNRVGSLCKVKLYQGQGHGFFNYEYLEYYNKTVQEADKFLQELGYLNTKNINKK